MTVSEKLRTRFAFIATPVAPSAGTELLNVGAVVSVVKGLKRTRFGAPLKFPLPLILYVSKLLPGRSVLAL